jgi:dihydroorotase
MDSISLVKPDDCHLHLRNGEILQLVLPHSVKQFARAVIMPNLKPPVTTVRRALEYRREICAALPPDAQFEPLMTLYLTAATKIEEVKQAAETECVIGFKLYPAGATTNSEQGVSDIEQVFPLFEAMEKHRVPLLIHAEVSGEDYDVFDREKIFIDAHLYKIAALFPQLRMVVEHLTTREAVQFILSTGPNIAATITPQHLMFNRNAIFSGGVRPHFYCLPILKREHHRLALLEAAVSGNPKFFLGTDSAPHLTGSKENHCGCAGCYTAYAALEMYAEVFDQAQALDKLEGFASFYGAAFYGLPRNSASITLQKQTWRSPEQFSWNTVEITPLLAGEPLSWQVAAN